VELRSPMSSGSVELALSRSCYLHAERLGNATSPFASVHVRVVSYCGSVPYSPKCKMTLASQSSVFRKITIQTVFNFVCDGIATQHFLDDELVKNFVLFG
jgi:hypothetical protein